jgi:hypothetical protein
VLFTAQPPFEHTRVFWIVFIDLAEGLAHVTLVLILILRVSRDASSSPPPTLRTKAPPSGWRLAQPGGLSRGLVP